jgi:hypothetical protein
VLIEVKEFIDLLDSPFSIAELRGCLFGGMHLFQPSKRGQAFELARSSNRLPPDVVPYLEATHNSEKEPTGLPIPKSLIKEINGEVGELEPTDALRRFPHWYLFFYDYQYLRIAIAYPSSYQGPNALSGQELLSNLHKDIPVNPDQSDEEPLSDDTIRIDTLYVWRTTVRIIDGRSGGSLAIKAPSGFQTLPATAHISTKIEEHFNEKNPDGIVYRDFYNIIHDSNSVLMYLRRTPGLMKPTSFDWYLHQFSWFHWNQHPTPEWNISNPVLDYPESSNT